MDTGSSSGCGPLGAAFVLSDRPSRAASPPPRSRLTGPSAGGESAGIPPFGGTRSPSRDGSFRRGPGVRSTDEGARDQPRSVARLRVRGRGRCRRGRQRAHHGSVGRLRLPARKCSTGPARARCDPAGGRAPDLSLHRAPDLGGRDHHDHVVAMERGRDALGHPGAALLGGRLPAVRGCCRRARHGPRHVHVVRLHGRAVLRQPCRRPEHVRLLRAVGHRPLGTSATTHAGGGSEEGADRRARPGRGRGARRVRRAPAHRARAARRRLPHPLGDRRPVGRGASSVPGPARTGRTRTRGDRERQSYRARRPAAHARRAPGSTG